MLIGKVYVLGLLILVGAILINFIAKLINLPTWYDFLEKPHLDIKNFIWLFIIYPLLLGSIVLSFKGLL